MRHCRSADEIAASSRCVSQNRAFCLNLGSDAGVRRAFCVLWVEGPWLGVGRVHDFWWERKASLWGVRFFSLLTAPHPSCCMRSLL